MREDPKFENFKKAIPVAKKFAEGIVISILDTLNTASPPGFEIWLWSEYSKLSNVTLGVLYNLERIRKVIEDMPLEHYPLVSKKIARGILIQEGRLGDIKRFRELVRAIESGKPVESNSPLANHHS